MTTKQYLRFNPGSVFGVVGSSTASIVPLEKNETWKIKDNFFAVPACENVYIWSLRTKEKSLVLNGDKSIVTCLVADSNYKNIAVGYADGVIRIFNFGQSECILSFIGHKAAVSCLTYEDGGSNLASGGRDSEIVIWNVSDEAGLYRMRGHKGPISKCLFFQNNTLISSSKDTFIKFWDLDTQHCFHTVVGSQYEILDIAIIKGTKLISGLNHRELKVWNLTVSKDATPGSPQTKKIKVDAVENEDSDVELEEDLDENKDEDSGERLIATTPGELTTAENKTSSIVVDQSERLMGIHGSMKFLRLYKILNPAEISKKLRKRRKKEMKRKQIDEHCDSVEVALTLEDEFQPLKSIHCASKIASFSLAVNEADIAKVTVLLKNNTIVQYEIDLKIEDFEIKMCHTISLPGHRSVVRSLTYSTDGFSMLSACDESVKIWRSFKDEQRCATTLDCKSALCSTFVTGNNHCIVGTKTGKLIVFNVDTRSLENTIEAHDGTVRCICVSPGLDGVTSGGSDQEVKFWDFELEGESSAVMKTLSLSLRRTLKMPEEIMCLKYSPDGKKIAISLLDSTVQVLFSDSLKLAFSLYGHELPVTCMDICHDSTLIVTGSNDRTIRIWSMEFGSCNRRLRITDEKDLRHDKGITCLQFLPKTHLFFTGSKDNVVRQWDADNFQKIVTLRGHHNEITAMTVSPDGISVVTASKDRSIRTWEKTREPLVLEEEQENEAEETDKQIEDLPEIPGEVNKEVALPGMKTVETIKTVDQLIEALDLYKSEVERMQEFELECQAAGKKLPPPAVHPMFMAYQAISPIEYMQKVVRRIKPSELEGALLHLPFNYVVEFLKIISEFADRGWEAEFSEKCATFLLRISFGQISTTRNLRPVIENLKDKLFKNMYHIRDMVGFVKVVSNLHQRSIDAREEVSLFSGILDDVKRKKKKPRRRVERAVVAFT